MSEQLDRLLSIMARLRAPNGCPWDREQTARSLRPYVIEEAHEVADAIDRGRPDALRDELGDLLLQVVFHAQIASEQGGFSFDDVARSISDKLERRHPHVFGEVDVEGVEQVWRNWEQIKRQESLDRDASSDEAAGKPSRLDGVPRHLPALVRAGKLSDKARRAGFDWTSEREVLGKAREEISELEEALDEGVERIEDELGDLLFALASFARRVDADPEGALARAALKFEGRFRRVEALAEAAGRELESLNAEELDALWNEAKSDG